MVLKLKDDRKELYQWDVGVVADVTDENINEVHFSNIRYGVSFNIEVKDRTVTIPPEVLQSGAGVFCWAFVRRENGGYTKKEQVFNVEKRPRPADYIYEPTEILTWETLKKQIEDVETALSGKVNKSDILTEVVTDEVYNDNQFYNANAVNSVLNIFNEEFVPIKTFNRIVAEVSNTFQTKVDKSNVLTEINYNVSADKIYNAPTINAVLLALQDSVRSLDERLTVIDGGINEVSALVGGA